MYKYSKLDLSVYKCFKWHDGYHLTVQLLLFNNNTQQHTSTSNSIHKHPTTSSNINIQQHPSTPNNIHQHPTTSINIQQHPPTSINIQQHTSTPNNIHQHPSTSNNIHQHPTFLTKFKPCTASYKSQHNPTTPNMGGQTSPTFVPNIVGICRAKMLDRFGQGLRFSIKSSVHGTFHFPPMRMRKYWNSKAFSKKLLRMLWLIL